MKQERLQALGVKELQSNPVKMLLMLETLLWMEVVLELKDADDWIYRGEGDANLVLAYSGSSPTFVLRIQKAPRIESPRNGNDSEDSHSALMNDECLMWRETEERVLAPTREIAEQLYVQHVISPLLGYEHVDDGIHVFLSKEFLEVAEKNILSQRPSRRVDAAMVNTLCDFVLLMSDHSVFPYVSSDFPAIIVSSDFPAVNFIPYLPWKFPETEMLLDYLSSYQQ
ncbi:hypothetical protein RHGRI_019157 [Rhododendron griersonianum]|uniref:Inositol-pentakisphosphate 2-kinase n=1 Tax=Rhododendron griersonianum TaxID=479676 RepID=A0AAV6JEV0_9ERIC|nr:hypothetical protein RHGRI_019157 [Rhododendron griersonianum]